MTKDELKIAWEKGTELRFAWVKFARFFDHFAWTALRTHPNNDPNISHHSRYQELNRGWLPNTWEARQRKLALVTASERLSRLHEIFDGELWAIGYRTLPDGSDEITRIPRQLFRIDDEREINDNAITINWEKGEIVTTNGESFFDVRIVLSPAQPQDGVSTAIDQPNETESIPEIGRPNTSSTIRQKVEELWKTPRFQAIATRMEQAREVRAQIHGEPYRLVDDMSGYKSSVIMRIIGQVSSARAGEGE